MAAVPQISSAVATTKAPVASQVDARIRAVNDAFNRAQDDLEGGLFGQSDAQRAASHVVEGLRDDIDRWAAKGRDAAAAKTSPYPNGRGWDGWIELGNVYLQELKAQANIGSTATLTAIVETVKNSPQATLQGVKKAAAEIEKVGTQAAWGIAKPVAAVLAGYLILRLVILR